MRNNQNGHDIYIVQEGKKLPSKRNYLELTLTVIMNYVFQFFPIIVCAIIHITTLVKFGFSDTAENVLVICIVSNATSMLNNIKNKKLNGSIKGKLFLFTRCMIIALGSIVYSILLISLSEETQQIITNMDAIIIFAVICVLLTVIISYLCVVEGGDI